MLKNSFFILLLTLGSRSYSQVSFYIRPVVSMKTNECFFPKQGNLRDKRNSIDNEYFSLIHYGRFFNREQINFGFHAGVQWNKHTLEFGLDTDNASLAYGISSHVVYIDTLTNARTAYESSGLTMIGTDGINRYSLTYQSVVWKNKNNTINIRAVAGLGVMHTKGGGLKKDLYIDTVYYPYDISEDINPNPPDVSFRQTSDISIQRLGFSLNGNIGFGIDFMSKQKQRNLFSIDIFYLHNLNIMYSEIYNFRVSDKMLTTDYVYTLHSRGSGFYFNISKKMQLYPWRKFKTKKEHLPYDSI